MDVTAPRTGVGLAIASAVLFGLSTPLAKLVLGEGVSPWLLAGLLYLGSGLGLLAFRRVRSDRGEAALPRSTWKAWRR